MRTRRSPRNQQILFRDLFKPPATPIQSVTPIDLSKAFWLSPRAKRQVERDRIAATHKAAIKRALSGS